MSTHSKESWHLDIKAKIIRNGNVKHQCSWRFVSSSSNIALESDQSASVLYSGLICQGSGYLVSGSVHLLASNDRTGADTTLYGLIWPMHTILSISNTDHKPSKQLRYKSMIFGVQASFVHTFGSGNRDNITDKILMHIDQQCMSPVKTLDLTSIIINFRINTH